jgi:hypothetical protein
MTGQAVVRRCDLDSIGQDCLALGLHQAPGDDGIQKLNGG